MASKRFGNLLVALFTVIVEAYFLFGFEVLFNRGNSFKSSKAGDSLLASAENEFLLSKTFLTSICEVHFEAIAISVDPYMRFLTHLLKPGDLMFGAQVAKVVKSRNPKFKPGDHVFGYFGWQTNFVGKPELLSKSPFTDHGWEEEPYVLPDFQGLPLSLSLGVLGMTGNTAYLGLMEICKPARGEVVVVSGAAGAVGSIVGQLAKIQGCKVIGFTGSDKKVYWLRNELKFDWAFNYKKIDIVEALKKAAPEGVDCYFDNVGGVMSSKVLTCMNMFGRIAVCGSISSYNHDISDPPLVPAIQNSMIVKQLKMEGFFVVSLNKQKWFEIIQENLKLIKEGKLLYKETITYGFENLPEALICMLNGNNTGKAVVLMKKY